MKQNMGSIDRVLRTIGALVLLVLSLTGTITGLVGTISIIIAVILLATALLGFCPLYAPFHFSTKKI